MFRTLAYADIFDYPLTREEIYRWLIKGDSFTKAKESPYWNYLPGRAKLVKLRRQRERISRVKLDKFLPIIYRLKIIRWIKLICVTGALAMNNADADDDIDLMIVTAKNRLWLTRALVSLLLFSRLRRGRLVDNRICINLWLDESAMAIEQQNLYLAHEICQARPIFERENFYDRFLGANLWYKKYLPNWTK